MAGQPAAFMSYARFDDQHEDGQLTAFRERPAEVRMQTGEEFHIFQDRTDIAWGQNWQQRINQTLDTVTLLLVIITPGFFRSPHCRAETEQFLDRESQLGRDDLILPVYYVSTPSDRRPRPPRRRPARGDPGRPAARRLARAAVRASHHPSHPQGHRAHGHPDPRHVLAPARQHAGSRPYGPRRSGQVCGPADTASGPGPQRR